jgi:hypothetical protein
LSSEPDWGQFEVGQASVLLRSDLGKDKFRLVRPPPDQEVGMSDQGRLTAAAFGLGGTLGVKFIPVSIDLSL